MVKMDKEMRERLEKLIVYIDGEYCSGIDAKLSIFDGGLYGLSLYDAISMWDGFIIKLDAHVRRIYEGLRAYDFRIPLSEEEYKEVLFETVRRSKLKRGVINVRSTYGTSNPWRLVNGEIGTPDRESTLLVCCVEYYWIGGSEDGQKAGLKARIPKIKDYPIQCIDNRIKNHNRLNYYLAGLELRGTDATIALMTDMDGYLGQATGGNLWVAKGGKLLTPGGNILYGITREAVFDMAKVENIEAIEARFTPFAAYSADEVFLSSSGGGIIPIVEVDKIRIGDGQPGPITKHLMDAYYKMHVDPKYATKVPGLE